MNFDKKQAVRMDLSNMSRWGPLFSKGTLCDMFKDGRLFGKLAERILAFEFDNLTLAKEGGPYDLEIIDESGVVEVKSFTVHGFDTSPSSMIGASRRYDPEGHKARIDMIRENNGYYILADNTELPIVTFYPIEATDQLIFTNTKGNKTGKRTYIQGKEFLKSLNIKVIDYS
jgi:hypothetical protein